MTSMSMKRVQGHLRSERSISEVGDPTRSHGTMPNAGSRAWSSVRTRKDQHDSEAPGQIHLPRFTLLGVCTFKHAIDFRILTSNSTLQFASYQRLTPILLIKYSLSSTI